jgi:hypothetical protein
MHTMLQVRNRRRTSRARTWSAVSQRRFQRAAHRRHHPQAHRLARASTESRSSRSTPPSRAAVLLGYDSRGESVQLIHEPCADMTFGHVDQLQQVFTTFS